jgi:hypothetical protein
MADTAQPIFEEIAVKVHEHMFAPSEGHLSRRSSELGTGLKAPEPLGRYGDHKLDHGRHEVWTDSMSAVSRLSIIAVLALLALPAGASASPYVTVENASGPPETLNPLAAAINVSNQLSINPGKVWVYTTGGMSQPLCPQAELFEGRASCVVEWRDGARTWWYAMATVDEHQIQNNIYSGNNTVPEGGDANDEATIWSLHHWTRKWTTCSLRGFTIPGTLTSNNNCGGDWPQSDAHLVGTQMWPDIRTHSGVDSVGWGFIDSAGYGLIGTLHAVRHGDTWTATNALGDSFRYTP